jgi:RimJ/RimL family protein N-acetyltransferase
LESKIKLRNIEKLDHDFLYNLLKERDSKMNISHEKMPTFSEHVKFVTSKPYTNWYIIEQSKESIGSIYLSKNDEVGIFLKNKCQNKGIGKQALNLLIEKNPRKKYFANINPNNSISATFFNKNGFKLIQHTYKLEMDRK